MPQLDIDAPLVDQRMPLRELQMMLQRHLLQAADAAPDADALSAAVIDAPPLAMADRVAIYQNGYRLRLIDALAETHPILVKILGDEDFAAAATSFIAARASVHRSIRWYGREFAAHLEHTEPYDQQPIFAELASFEWTLSEAFDAPDAPRVDRSALQQIAPERWGELRLRFHPSLRRLSLRWNTVAVWRAMSQDENPPDPEALDSAGHWLLWRQDFKSTFRSLEPDERAALDVAVRGDSFAEVCVALASHVLEDEIPIRAATFIAGWIDNGMVAATASER